MGAPARDEGGEDTADRVLADCVADYHRRKDLGESPRLEDYASRAGRWYPDLRDLLEMDAAIGAAVDDRATGSTALPRRFGEYTLVRELGRGAMGVVYEAIHRPLGRTVALKVLKTGLDTDDVALERFRREARACVQVRHPNIVEVYDAGRVDDQPYYSMALLCGRTLRELIHDDALPSVPSLCRGFAAVADALRALHEAGIVHRDVKPSNIVVADDGSMVLADFGIARVAQSERVTATGQPLGTPLFMSPEQILGRAADVDGRTDVYGLGATMYEALTRRPVFQFEDISSAARLILTERPLSPRSVRRDVPEAVERIVLKCLEKSKEDRYPTAAALRDDLLNFAEGRSVVGRPVSRVGRGLRRLRRLAPAIAAGLAAAAVAVWLWTHRDATLSVRCWPAAAVTIDGVSAGDTPVETRLAPGRHLLTLAQSGFTPHTDWFELGAGERSDLRIVLIAQRADDPEALERIARELGIALASFEPIPSRRGANEPDVVLLWPRGEVRREDAARWCVVLSPRMAASGPVPGRIEFRRGESMLHSAPFDPHLLTTEGSLPAGVTAALSDGDSAAWSYVPDDGPPVTVQFTISSKGASVAQALRRIDEATAEQPIGIAGRLRARLLLDAGLPLAAYREARAARDFVVAQHALDRLELVDTRPWREAVEAIEHARGK